MNRTGSRFQELDSLILRLKGLVLVREIRKGRDAGEEELQMYSTEIEGVRDQLADLVKNGGSAGRLAA
jgi:hypothetical protein